MDLDEFAERFPQLSAAQLRDSLASGQLPLQAVVEQYFQRAQALEQSLGATNYLLEQPPQLSPDQLQQLRGTVLAGLPTVAKDLWDVAGMPTTSGTAALPVRQAQHDSPAIAALKESGAVFFGKTQVPEFGLSAYSENKVAAPARNPYDLRRSAGGSSGGSAAAVAAAITPVALGSDAGGSIRIPAASCSLVGLKPGRGSIPADRAGAGDEVRGTVADLVCTGPLARTSEDAGLLHDALLQRRDGFYRSAAIAGARGACPALRIGVSTASPFTPDLDIHLSWQALTALTQAELFLQAAGQQVQPANIRYAPGYFDAFTTVWTASLQREPHPDLVHEELMELTRSFVQGGPAGGFSQLRWEHAMTELTAFADDARTQWDEFDVILTPVLAFAPPEVGVFTALSGDADYRLQCQFTPYTSMVNVCGMPALSIPTWWDASTGLSFSVQLIGHSGSEAQLLMLAAAIETQRGPLPAPDLTQMLT